MSADAFVFCLFFFAIFAGSIALARSMGSLRGRKQGLLAGADSQDACEAVGLQRLSRQERSNLGPVPGRGRGQVYKSISSEQFGVQLYVCLTMDGASVSLGEVSSSREDVWIWARVPGVPEDIGFFMGQDGHSLPQAYRHAFFCEDSQASLRKLANGCVQLNLADGIFTIQEIWYEASLWTDVLQQTLQVSLNRFAAFVRSMQHDFAKERWRSRLVAQLKRYGSIDLQEQDPQVELRDEIALACFSTLLLYFREAKVTQQAIDALMQGEFFAPSIQLELGLYLLVPAHLVQPSAFATIHEQKGAFLPADQRRVLCEKALRSPSVELQIAAAISMGGQGALLLQQHLLRDEADGAALVRALKTIEGSLPRGEARFSLLQRCLRSHAHALRYTALCLLVDDIWALSDERTHRDALPEHRLCRAMSRALRQASAMEALVSSWARHLETLALEDLSNLREVLLACLEYPLLARLPPQTLLAILHACFYLPLSPKLEAFRLACLGHPDESIVLTILRSLEKEGVSAIRALNELLQARELLSTEVIASAEAALLSLRERYAAQREGGLSVLSEVDPAEGALALSPEEGGALSVASEE